MSTRSRFHPFRTTSLGLLQMGRWTLRRRLVTCSPKFLVSTQSMMLLYLAVP